MEHEQSYALMMDALDGVLNPSNQDALDQHLLSCTTCRYEWDALQAVELLLNEAPLVEPPPNFVQQTLALLPDYRLRAWTAGIAYLLFLLGGLVPVSVIGWLGWQMVNQPALIRVLGQTVDEFARVSQLIFGALFQILGSTGDLLAQYPVIPGLLFVMLGSIALWVSVYEQALSPTWATVTTAPRSH